MRIPASLSSRYHPGWSGGLSSTPYLLWPGSYLQLHFHIATAAAKSLQSCLTLCDPVDGSPPGSPIPGILQARVLEQGAAGSQREELCCGKGHEEGGSALCEGEIESQKTPCSRASTPKPECLLYCFMLSPTTLTLQGALPHHLSRRRS